MANFDELDELLSELESEAGSKSQKSWSLDEIDALLSNENMDDFSSEPVEEPSMDLFEDIEEPTVEEIPEEPEVEIEKQDEEPEEDLDEPEPITEETAPAEEPAEKPKKAPRFQIFNLQLGRDKKKQEILEQVLEEEPEEEVAVEKVTSVPVNDDDLEFLEDDKEDAEVVEAPAPR
ncbi:MAG: hypothetical protein KBS82_06215, partial [Oscillospiraceae bacterium]|nr:hypothetical protein [Candidatus Limimonas egerieequi]